MRLILFTLLTLAASLAWMSYIDRTTGAITGERKEQSATKKADYPMSLPAKTAATSYQDQSYYYLTRNDWNAMKSSLNGKAPPAYLTLPSGLEIHFKATGSYYCPKVKRQIITRAPSKGFRLIQ